MVDERGRRGGTWTHWREVSSCGENVVYPLPNSQKNTSCGNIQQSNCPESNNRIWSLVLYQNVNVIQLSKQKCDILTVNKTITKLRHFSKVCSIQRDNCLTFSAREVQIESLLTCTFLEVPVLNSLNFSRLLERHGNVTFAADYKRIRTESA